VGAQVGNYQEISESFLRESEAKAKVSEERQTKLAEGAATAKRYAEAASANDDDNDVKQKKYREWLDQDLTKLREPPVEPEAWQKTVSTLSKIVGAVAMGWLGPVGAGVAIGMDAIDRNIQKNVYSQLEQKDRARENLDRTSNALDILARDSENEADAAHKLVANHWVATSVELERLAEKSKSAEEREAYQRLALGAKGKGEEILQRNYEQQIAEQRAMAAARARAKAKGPDWAQFDQTTLEAFESSGRLPIEGQNVLNEARKKAREASGEGKGKDSEAERKLARLSAGVEPAYLELKEWDDSGKDVPYFGVRKGTGVIPDALLPEENLTFSNQIEALSSVLLRDESGAVIGEDESERKRKSWGIDSGDPEIRKKGLRNMLYEFEARRANGTLPAPKSTGSDPRIRKGFGVPNAADRGVNVNPNGSIALPRGEVSPAEFRAAQQAEADEELRRSGFVR
jgi:hypothetical protein